MSYPCTRNKHFTTDIWKMLKYGIIEKILQETGLSFKYHLSKPKSVSSKLWLYELTAKSLAWHLNITNFKP